MRFLSILGLFALFKVTLCDNKELRLHTVDDFMNFANAVNTGTDYKKTTVFLEATLDFSNYTGEFNPIGIDEDNAFAGTFDGQGFALGNIILNVTEGKYAGFFGYTKGATIKNIVFSMTNVIHIESERTESSTAEDRLYAGGLVAYCEKVGGYCKVENSVNIANVTYEGMSDGKVYIGGIAGYIYSRYESHIRNCANYGLVASYGGSKSVDIGGIIGHYSGSSTILTVNNCLNLGPIYFDGRITESWSAGGIVGHSEYCAFDNCVSAANIISPGVYKFDAIGVFSGKSSYTTFKNCYWNKEAGTTAPGTETEECSSYDGSTFELHKKITAGNYTGNKLLDALNTAVDYYVLYDYSHWGYSTGKYTIDFTINNRTKRFIPDTQLLLLPGLSSEGALSFDGWYTDSNYTSPLKDYIFESNLEVFGHWGENTKTYTITYDLRGGSFSTEPVREGVFNSEVTLPSDATKGSCMLGWWENDYGDQMDWDYTVPAHDITLHAVWGCTEIESASDLIGMAKIVNSGTSYKSITVHLLNDIKFTKKEAEQFEPIGKDNYMNFEGVFDGHGYTISGLKVETTLGSTGLFGYSKGATIRNVVMDSTCSVVSSYGSLSSTDVESFYGSFMGYCETLNGNCTIENSVNMADVTYTGESSTNIFIGGLAGYLMTTQNYRSNVINCVNYGITRHGGKTSTYVDIGGLIGGCNGGSKGASVYNSMNYGNIHNEGDFKTPCLGGIVGYSVERSTYENCVNFGKINTDPSKSTDYVGSIAGEVYSGCVIKNCYFGNKNEYDAAGIKDDTIKIESSTSFDSNTFNFSEHVTVGNYTGESLVDALNTYVEMYLDMNYSNWVFNKDRYTITFVITNRTEPFVSFDSQIILIPNISNIEKEIFFGWFIYANYSQYFSSSVITKDITLYGFMNETYVPPEVPIITSNEVNVTVIVACSVSLFVVIVLIVIAFILWSKFQDRFATNREIQELMEPVYFDRFGNSIDMLDLYPVGYKKPTLKKALINAGIELDKAESLSAMCYRHADNLMEAKKLPRGITLDDAAAVALYTIEDDSLDQNPYRLINEALMKGDIEELKPVKDLLCLVMRALRKMPIVYNKPLYRGIRSDVLSKEGRENNYDDADFEPGRDAQTMYDRGVESFEEDYLEGEETVWPALSSTSPDVTVTKAFLAKGSATGKAEGTLFIIENGWGYNVQSCSMFPGEEEIVLEPERRFRVKTVIPGEGLTIIKMEMLRTPLVLTDVFGEKKIRVISKN